MVYLVYLTYIGDFGICVTMVVPKYRFNCELAIIIGVPVVYYFSGLATGKAVVATGKAVGG